MRFFVGFAIAFLLFSVVFATALLLNFIKIEAIDGYNVGSTSSFKPTRQGQPTSENSVAATEGSKLEEIKRESFGDWIYSCIRRNDKNSAECNIFQSLSETSSSQLLLLWKINKLSNGELVGVWEVPRTVLLGEGITIDAGTPEPIVVPYRTCAGMRCVAIANMANEYVELLRNTDKIFVSVVLINNRRARFAMSVEGLKEAIDTLRNLDVTVQ